MTQILGSVCVVVIIVIIAAVMIAVCGGLRIPKPDSAPQAQPRRRPSSGGAQPQAQPRHAAYQQPQQRHRAAYQQPQQRRSSNNQSRQQPRRDYEPENMTGPARNRYDDPLSDAPTGRSPMQLTWILELIDDDDRVISRYDVPDCSNCVITLGRSSKNDMHISGYGDMSREHLIFSQDRKGVYFEASDQCSSTVTVNGQLIFNGQNDTDTKSSRTYLRDGMVIKLGSARLRVVYE